MQCAGHHKAQNVPRSLPTAIPTTRKQGDKLPGRPWVVFPLFVQLLSSTIHSAGQAAPVGIKGPAGSRNKRATVPRVPPTPVSSHPPQSPGDSLKGAAWPRNRSRCYLTLSREVYAGQLRCASPRCARQRPISKSLLDRRWQAGRWECSGSRELNLCL